MIAGCPDYQTTRQISRRGLLRAGTAGLVGLSLPALFAPNRRAKPALAPGTLFSSTSLVDRRTSTRLT